MMTDIGDVIELTVDIPEKNLRAGIQGTVVHVHGDNAYEVEFTDEAGETLDFLPLHSGQFIVVWQVETQQWVPVTEQATALLANLPEEAAQEVLDFARFLSVRSRKSNGRRVEASEV